MKVYYIDYENVKHYGLEGIEKIDKSGKVYIMCGINDTIRLVDISYFMKSKAKFEIIIVSTGKKDALDFQLITHLMLKYSKNNEYIIISNDQGYDFAIEMAERLGKDKIKRYTAIKEALEAVNNSDTVNNNFDTVNNKSDTVNNKSDTENWGVFINV